MKKVEIVKNVLFILIGLIAFVNSMSREINRETMFCLELQLFAFTMLTIGGCGLYKAIKNGKTE